MENLGIQGSILTPGSIEYADAIQRRSELSVLEPAYIVQPTVYTDIPPVLAYAAAQDPRPEIAVKGGGCHTATWSSSNGGIVLDLSRLNKVTLAADKASAVVQGGATWGDVYEVGRDHGVEFVGAPLWFVGVGGSMLGGATGNLTGAYGLGIDNLLAATVVLADGRIVKTSAEEEPDLFWAIRGGGGQFGIVVEYVVKAYPNPGPSTIGLFVYPEKAFDQTISILQNFMERATEHQKLTVFFMRPPPAFQPCVIVAPWISAADSVAPDENLKPFRTQAETIAELVTTVPDQFRASHSGDAALAHAGRRLCIRGGAVEELWTDMLQEVWNRWVKFTKENEDAKTSLILWEPRKADKMAAVGQQDTAFPMRHPHISMAIQGRNTRPETDGVTQEFVKSVADYVRETNVRKTGRDLGVYLSMARGDEGLEAVFGPNLPRLKKLKAKYDPTMLWTKGIAIQPDFN